MALTGKKRTFADAVLAGSSNKEAAIAAGYSPATAAQSGSRMAKDPKIAAYLAENRGADATKVNAPPAPKPPAPPPAAAAGYSDPEQFLVDQMNDDALDMRMRIDVAKALMPYRHQKLGEGGKKDQKQDAAKKAASKFAPAAAPKLVVNNK